MAERWQNFSPGDLSIALPEVEAGDVEGAVGAAQMAAPDWAARSLESRIEHLRAAQAALTAAKERLARGISLETGKPLTEANGEVGAVIAKIDLTIDDAEQYLADVTVSGGPHPAAIRRRARGPAAVVGPFNFPLHLGHGANVAHLLAGNPVIFKPSPLAANVAAEYGSIMAPAFPPGVFTLLQGGGKTGEALCLDSRIRAVCFTGSVPVGRALAQALATDFSKDLALELGGSNAVVVCADADLALAAQAVADGACLTTGQRCNATSRVIVERKIADAFTPLFLAAVAAFEPGDPMLPETRLGPLINATAVARYEAALREPGIDWLLPGRAEPLIAGKRGHYVRPAVARTENEIASERESFFPLVRLHLVDDLHEAVRIHNRTPFGLTASLFTRSEELFRKLGDRLEVGNLYANLPTTFSPSTLPFGGWKQSGNGKPGGRNFVRFTSYEQSLQWKDFKSAS